MKGNIKGITIEFNGDTTKLGNALRDLNKQTKEVDKALRDVNNALKFNPGNTELLAQKQTLLKQKIEQTKEKLDALRIAQAKLDDDPAVDKTSQEYMELRREIIETESKLKHFEGELKKLKDIKFEQIGTQVKNVGDKMQTVGTAMTKYVTTPIVAGAGLSVKAWKEVDEGLDIVTAKTGATGKSLEGMQDIVKNLAGKIPADFETIGSAVGEVNTRFKLTGTELEDLSGKYVKFAQLNDQDVSTAVDKTQKVLSAFNLDVKDAGPLLDTLTKVAQDTGVSVEALEDSMVKNAATLQQSGLSYQEAATFLGQLEVSGVDADKAMVGLNKALVKGAKEGKDFPTLMRDLQKEISGASTDTEAMAIASEYFGTKSGPALAQAIRNGTINLEEMAGASSDAEGALEKTFEDTLDPADKFALMLNNLKVLGYEVADVLFDMLEPALEKLVTKTKELSKKWKELDPEQQKLIIKIAGIVAALGPLLLVGGKLVSGIGSLITNIPKITGACSSLFSLLAAHPILLIVGALAALTAAFIATGGDVDKFKEKIKEFANKAIQIIKTIAEKLPEMIPVIAEAAKEVFTSIAEVIPEILPPLIDAFTELITALAEALPELIPVLINGALQLFMACVDVMPTVLEALVKAFGILIKTLIEHFPEYYLMVLDATLTLWGAILDAFKEIGGKVLEFIGELVGGVIEGLQNKLSEIWDNIKTTAKQKWDAITQTILNIVTGLITGVHDFFEDNINALKQNWEDTKDAAKDKWTQVRDRITEKVKDIKDNTKKKFSENLTNLKQNWEDTKTAAREKWKNIKKEIEDVVGNLKKYLSDAWSNIKKTAGDAWNKIKDTILYPIEQMKDKIEYIIDTIKGWFENIHINTPNIELPHPYISPSGWSISDLMDGIVPEIGIDWYKKGGIFDAPTIAGIGEAGAEAVVPLDKFWQKMDAMAESIVNGLIVGLRTMPLQGAGAENVTIPIYLYPSGPKMGEETVKMYDTYKRRLG